MKITLVVAMDRNNLIGKDGDMPWHLPADLAHFKRTTLGYPVLMGRKTWQSIGRPLPGRDNYVLSTQKGWQAQGAKVLKDFADVERLGLDALMVIGGASLYNHFLPLADKLVITHIDADLGPGDTYFPPIKPAIWKPANETLHPRDQKNNFNLSFVQYARI